LYNNDLTANSKKFKFGYVDGEYGYYKQEGGADTFSPFKSDLRETTLWTNPSPASSISSQVKSLDSGKFSDYTYIKVVFRGGTSTAGQQHETSVIMPMSEFELTNDANLCFFLCGAYRSDNNNYIRRVWYTTDTSFHIGTGQRTSDNVTSNSSVIPYKVIGLKIG
jgi:hypothetical protein